MPRLDLYRWPGNGTGYVVNIQSTLLDTLRTRTIIPRFPQDASPKPIQTLNPSAQIEGGTYVLATQLLASVPVRELGPAIGSMDEWHNDIARALDVLINGV